jgi:hypothetical protein
LRLHFLGQEIGTLIFQDLDRSSGGRTTNIGRTDSRIGILTGILEASDYCGSVKPKPAGE